MASIASRASLAALVLAGAASAELLPPERPFSLPTLAVADEHDARRDLGEIAAGALLLPIFTRCTGTCPMTAVLLKDALAKARSSFPVVVFSFDAQDTARDLREFRERFALPAGWRIVRVTDAGDARAFLDGLDFPLMKSGAAFDHPNRTFVFSPRGSWAGTFAGTAFPADELETARRRALAADDPSMWQQARAWMVRPSSWIAAACAGLAASLGAIVLARRARR